MLTEHIKTRKKELAKEYAKCQQRLHEINGARVELEILEMIICDIEGK